MGQKLRFLLRGVQAQQVVWLFDDQKAVRSSVQVEYAFTQDAADPQGLLSSHRIDALFKVGDSYIDVTIYVNVENIRYSAMVDIQPSGLSVTADSKLTARSKSGSHLKLVGASLEKYSGGKFIEGSPLALDETNGGTVQLAISKDAAANSLSYHTTSDFTESPVHSDKTAWIAYDFSERNTGEQVKVYQPLLGEKAAE